MTYPTNTTELTAAKLAEFEIANLRDRLNAAIGLLNQQRDENAKLDSMLNKTIDAHEVTKQRLLGYENEAGVPKSESERDAYTSYNPK